MAKSGRVCMAASKALITALFSSAATGNLPWQACTEKRVISSRSSPDTPITDAPSASNLPMASANWCASIEQASENAAGKKYSTTGPLASCSDRLYWNTLPPSAAGTVKSGAASPTSSAACTGRLSAAQHHRAVQWRVSCPVFSCAFVGPDAQANGARVAAVGASRRAYFRRSAPPTTRATGARSAARGCGCCAPAARRCGPVASRCSRASWATGMPELRPRTSTRSAVKPCSVQLTPRTCGPLMRTVQPASPGSICHSASRSVAAVAAGQVGRRRHTLSQRVKTGVLARAEVDAQRVAVAAPQPNS